MTLRLFLIRHGLSSFNKEFRIQGRNDLSTLSEEGKTQASMAGKFLSQLPVHSIYSSPLKRAAETTKRIIKERNEEISPVYTDELLEIDLEPWTGFTKEQVKKLYPEAHFTWQKDPIDLEIKRKNGSSYMPLKELMEQAHKFLENIVLNFDENNEKNIFIIGHNAILRCLLIQLLDQPSNVYRKIQIDNASISVINVKSKSNKPYKVQLESINSTTHLNSSLPENKSDARLILVRHGETDWNQEGRFQGQIDIPLNSNGKNQAILCKKFLENIVINKAYSSSMSRPKETALEILKCHEGVKLNLKSELKEINHGLWEGKLETEIKEEWPSLISQWQLNPQEVLMPEGESIQDVWKRSVSCFNNLCKTLEKNETALLVAHDAVNKTILCELMGLKEKDIWMIKQSNGGITVIDIKLNEKITYVITSLNITSHLGGVLDQTAKGAL